MKKSLTWWRAAVALGLMMPCMSSWQGPAWALDPARPISQYTHRVWKSENGLPQNTIRCITQTREGYLWLGTQGGLVRFDGVQFTTFDTKNTKAIRNNYVTSLYEDADGVLWIGTYGGITRLKDGNFTVLTTADGLPDNVVGAVRGNRDGSMCIGTIGSGFCILKDGKYTAFTTKDGLSGDIIYTFCEGRDGSVWIGTDGGLSRLKDGKLTSYTTANGLPCNIVRAVHETSDGTLWIGTYGGGLARLVNGKFTLLGSNDGVSNDRIYSIFEDRDGSIWAGTDGGGLNRLRGGRISRYTARDGLSANKVHSIYEDREGNLWIGTDGGGLNQFQEGKVTSYSTGEGIADDVVRVICEDKAGDIWIGTHGGGLNRVRKGSISTYTTKDGLLNNVVWALCEAKDGNLWIGTYGGGVNCLTGGGFSSYTTRDGLSSDMVRAICEGQDGAIWIGTHGGGLNRLKDGRFTVYTTKDGLLGNVVRDIQKGRDGCLWIGTNHGFNKLVDGKFTSYATDEMVYALYLDGEGTLWFGTNGGGLGRLKDGKITSYTTDDGLYDNTVYRILEDSERNLWMSSAKGIFRAAKKQLDDFASGTTKSIDCISYGEADGMESHECSGGSQPAGWKTHDGKLWFPTVKGAVEIDPDHMKINEVPPPVLVEQLIVDGATMNPVEGRQLPPGEGRIEIHYTALSLIAPDQVRFRYMLEGFDGTWIDPGARRAAYYTNLAPGKYRFRVIACNNDRVWNTAGATFSFSLQPHFYQTYWFYALAAVVLALTGAGIYRTRTRQLRLREQELAERVNERTRELQLEILERKRVENRLESSLEEKVVLLKEIHHRVKNNLQVISSFLSLESSLIADQKALEVFKESQNRVRSMAMIHEKLYRSKDLGRIDTADYFETLINSILRSYQLDGAVKLQIAVQNITLDLDTAIPCGLIINELVSNALKHAFPQIASDPGEHPDKEPSPAPQVIVRMSTDEKDKLRLTVEDNGVGFPAGLDFFSTSSLGLSLVNLLTEQLDGTVEVENRNGMRFTIRFPRPARRTGEMADAPHS